MFLLQTNRCEESVYTYMGKMFDWRKSQRGFDPSLKYLEALATLMSCDTTK